MIIQLYPSENFDRAEARRLLKDLQDDGIPAEPGGTYQRRSVEDLPPLVQLIITGVAAGVFNGIGEDAWGLVKRATKKVFESRSNGQQPQIIWIIETDEGSGTLWNVDPSIDLNSQLDAALRRLQEIGKPADLWYDKESEKWQTLDERLSRGK